MGWTRAGRRRRRRKGDLEASRASQLRPLSHRPSLSCSRNPSCRKKFCFKIMLSTSRDKANTTNANMFNPAPPQHLSGSVASPHIGLAHTNWTNCRKKSLCPSKCTYVHDESPESAQTTFFSFCASHFWGRPLSHNWKTCRCAQSSGNGQSRGFPAQSELRSFTFAGFLFALTRALQVTRSRH